MEISPGEWISREEWETWNLKRKSDVQSDRLGTLTQFLQEPTLTAEDRIKITEMKTALTSGSAIGQFFGSFDQYLRKKYGNPSSESSSNP